MINWFIYEFNKLKYDMEVVTFWWFHMIALKCFVDEVVESFVKYTWIWTFCASVINWRFSRRLWGMDVARCSHDTIGVLGRYDRLAWGGEWLGNPSQAHFTVCIFFYKCFSRRLHAGARFSRNTIMQWILQVGKQLAVFCRCMSQGIKDWIVQIWVRHLHLQMSDREVPVRRRESTTV